MRAVRVEQAIDDPVFAPDLLGYGESNSDGTEITLAAQVRFLRGFVDRIAPGRKAHLVGHSLGGAIAMLFAYEHPDLVCSIVNVEGNFTLNDAFWSRAFAQMQLSDVERSLAADRADPAAWLRRSGVTPTEDRAAIAVSHLTNQKALTVQAMARSVVEVTGSPEYLDSIQRVMSGRTPVHLVAGERSSAGWDVPIFVRASCASDNVIPDCGHLVTIEQPEAFGALVRALTR